MIELVKFKYFVLKFMIIEDLLCFFVRSREYMFFLYVFIGKWLLEFVCILDVDLEVVGCWVWIGWILFIMSK